jgi:hypothetical protein
MTNQKTGICHILFISAAHHFGKNEINRCRPVESQVLEIKSRHRNDVGQPSATEKHSALRKEVGDVEPLGFESLIHRVTSVPETQIVSQRLYLIVGNNCIHILRSRSSRGRVVEAQPDSASTVNNKTDFVAKLLVQRQKQPLRMGDR